MKENTSMEAFLDDYGKIVVYLSQRFYNGKSDRFYLERPQGEATTCQIRELESHESYTRYTLTGPAEVQIGESLEIVEEHGHRAVLQYRRIVQTARFDQDFAYEGELGAFCEETQTRFALWAPTACEVQLDLRLAGKQVLAAMTRGEKGVWRLTVEGDWDGGTYLYQVKVNGELHLSPDPYALSSTANGLRSGLVNWKRMAQMPNSALPPFTSYTDAVIYELSVRDFTHQAQCGTRTHSQYRSLCEVGTTLQGKPTGLDYLASLGVTHVQLMPVADFATVDEEHPDLFYNWGYDPLQYGCPEGSYASDPNDPRCRVRELKQLVATLHARGLRVNLDVVFNHHYDIQFSAFGQCVPYYYFRTTPSGFLSNGSFCGNDTDSLMRMMRKYIVDIVCRWIEVYDVDGFRFDLMGIHDVDTMNAVVAAGRKLKPELMVYGEGWDLPTALNDDLKACQRNNAKMPQVAHFNDYFRDVVKGKTSDFDVQAKGYATGNLYQAHDMPSALCANTLNKEMYKIYQQPSQSINYVECHDNATSWDKMKDCCKDEVREIRVKRQKLMIAVTLVAQGVPFLQSGQEFCRTKYGYHNTYNAPDNVNQIDWERKNRHEEVVEYTRDCLRLRKLIRAFRFASAEEIESHVHFEVTEGQMLLYQLNDVEAYGGYQTIKVFFNPSPAVQYVELEEDYQQIFNEAGLLTTPVMVRNLAVNPITMVVVVK